MRGKLTYNLTIGSCRLKPSISRKDSNIIYIYIYIKVNVCVRSLRCGLSGPSHGFLLKSPENVGQSLVPFHNGAATLVPNSQSFDPLTCAKLTCTKLPSNWQHLHPFPNSFSGPHSLASSDQRLCICVNTASLTAHCS